MGAINAGVYAGVPSCKYLMAKAVSAIAKGNVVAFSQVTVDGITVVPAGATGLPVGIAQHAAATGEKVRIQTRGQGQVAITSSGTGTAAGDYLYAVASARVTDVAVGSTADVDTALQLVGLATVTTGATALPAATYIVMCPHSWWD
jgi:hypothetical protein